MGSPNDFYAARPNRKPALLVKYKSGRDEFLKVNNTKDRDKARQKRFKLNTWEDIELTCWE